MEEDCYKIKAVSQGRQGSWTTWEGVVNRNICWSDLWKIPQARLSFLIRSIYDTHPCPRNLYQWFGNEECCSLCNAPNTSLLHTSYQAARPRFHRGATDGDHDQVLRKLAEVLEVSQQSKKDPLSAEDHTSFVSEGGVRRNTRPTETSRPFSPDQE